ncbi:MAG: phosphatase PAP2 family protein [Jatrophihabitantaceae bacterium]
MPGTALRLVPPRLRATLLVVSAVAGVVLVLLAVRYAGTSSAGRLDRAIDNRLVLRVGRVHIRLSHDLANLGSASVVVAASAATAVVMLCLRRWRAAALAVLAPAVAGGVTELILKPLVDRTISDGPISGEAFPSGHATGVFSVAFVVSLLVLGGQLPRLARSARIVIAAGAILVAVATAFGLVAAAFHYTTDTIGGACVAWLVVIGVALGLDAVAERLSARPPSGSPAQQVLSR